MEESGKRLGGQSSGIRLNGIQLLLQVQSRAGHEGSKRNKCKAPSLIQQSSPRCSGLVCRVGLVGSVGVGWGWQCSRCSHVQVSAGSKCNKCTAPSLIQQSSPRCSSLVCRVGVGWGWQCSRCSNVRISAGSESNKCTVPSFSSALHVTHGQQCWVKGSRSGPLFNSSLQFTTVGGVGSGCQRRMRPNGQQVHNRRQQSTRTSAPQINYTQM